MSIWTGGGFSAGHSFLGTPSGGGTFRPSFDPTLPGFRPTGIRSEAEVSPTSSRSGWSDVFKDIVTFGAQAYITRKLTPRDSASQRPAVPNERGDVASQVALIPIGAGRPLGNVEPSRMGVTREVKTIAPVILLIGAGVVIVGFAFGRK